MGELLPYLTYDSGAMRSVSATMRAHATTLSTVGSEVAGAGGSMTFDGPAGDRLRQELADCAKDATHAGDGLVAAAGQLDKAADDVDAQNAAIRLHNNKVLNEMSPMERKLVRGNH